MPAFVAENLTHTSSVGLVPTELGRPAPCVPPYLPCHSSLSHQARSEPQPQVPAAMSREGGDRPNLSCLPQLWPVSQPRVQLCLRAWLGLRVGQWWPDGVTVVSAGCVVIFSQATDKPSLRCPSLKAPSLQALGLLSPPAQPMGHWGEPRGVGACRVL